MTSNENNESPPRPKSAQNSVIFHKNCLCILSNSETAMLRVSNY
jgi:hypothetical protein